MKQQNRYFADYTSVCWNKSPSVLYHGTLESHAQSIMAGITLQHAPFRTGGWDFGRGFYTSFVESEARGQALKKSSKEEIENGVVDKPIVIKLEIDPPSFCALSALIISTDKQ